MMEFRKMWKQLICTNLMLAMLGGLTACGSAGAESAESSGWGEDNTALAKEYVYEEQAIELPDMGGNTEVLQVYREEETVYAVCRVYENVEGDSRLKLLSMGTDGVDVQLNAMQSDAEASPKDLLAELPEDLLAQLPEDFHGRGYQAFAEGGEVADYVYSTQTGVYAMNVGDSTSRQLMSFINSDVPTTNMTQLLVLDEARFLGFYYDDFTHDLKCSVFTGKDAEEIQDKTVLVLAGYYVSSDVKQRVHEFNKSNPQYKIVVKEYYVYDTAEDGTAGYTRLNLDIVSGGLPDILITDSYFPVSDYIAKGLAADIGQLIAADAELSKEEFMQNVFDAYSVNEKLYYLIPSFSVRTLVGKTSVVGERDTWTVQDMMELLADMPAGTQAISEQTRDSFLELAMAYCGNEFVDVATGKCEFDSDEFVALLEFAKTFPEEIDWEEYWEKEGVQYRENMTLLAECDVSQARYVKDFIGGYFGEAISYIGFPTDSGEGAVVKAGEQYIISAKSKHIEGAWEFLRYYLTDEYQEQVIGFPVNREIFAERAKETTENPYYMDENGNRVEYKDKFYLNGENIELPNLTEEQADAFVEFVEGINKAIYCDEEVLDIVKEEAAFYFAGQKSASEVAGIIQSRAQILVDEGR